ncbi:MAG: M48 family metalloprotease [Acidimicrobiia bacterium]|nr:M48 family metalloprotease [Acidimicrobiia bacterium]
MPSLTRSLRVLLVELLIGALVIFAVEVAAGLVWWLAVIVAVVIMGALGVYIVRTAPAAVASMVKAEPADPVRHERLTHLVASLCLANGLAEPEILVIPEAAPNALVVGRSARQSKLIVTDGLLHVLNRIELEGVVAHLLSRVRSSEVGNDTLAAVVVGRWLAPFVGVRTQVLHWVVGPHHAMRADFEAVSMTRYPPGLESALATLSTHHQSVRSGGRPTQHLWIDEPVASHDEAIHLPLAERIEALQEI